ncbi:MAG: T9SS type A sorting domain-containing protein [Flavobacteriales bacterium]|nr:T9SS type A sorting domain-containing protein [Flavobacteriales bacterium]
MRTRSTIAELLPWRRAAERRDAALAGTRPTKSRLASALAAIPLAGLLVAGLVNTASAQFNNDNLAVLVAAASANNTTVSVVEIDKNTVGQSAIQTIAVSGVDPDAIRVSGSATSTLYASNSSDGSLFCFTGHNNTNTGSNANTLNPRAVVTINNAGVVTLATTYTAASGNQTRGATTLNNSNWFIGDQGGFYTNGSSSSSPGGNIRSVKAFGSTVYGFTASASVAPVGVVSAPSGGSFTALPGIPLGATSMQDFYLVSSGDNGADFDILYILQATSATVGTLYKYSLVGGTWVANGTYASTFGGFGLAAEKNGAGASLYVSTGTGASAANSVRKLVDAAGFNATINITANTVLYTAAAGTIIKGLAFAPQSTATPVVDAPVPTSLGGFLTTLGTPSDAQTFSITASDLAASLVIAAPAGFEVREEGVGSYGSSVSFAAAASLNKTIEVRLIGDAVAFYAGVEVSITSTGATSQAVTLDGQVEAPPTPTLNAGTLAAFGTLCINNTAGPLSFDLSGFNLDGDVTIGPLEGFTFSDDEFGSFDNTLVLSPDFGELEQPVYVLFAPTLVQDYSGNIPVSGGGADAIDVSASGEGVNTLATVATGAASNVSFSGATLAGTISATGCSALSDYGIEYSTTSGFTPGTGTPVAGSNLAGINFSVALSGLDQGTGYFYRAYATNSGGTAYGDEQVFYTQRPVITRWNFNGPSTTTVPGGATAPTPSEGVGTASLVGGTTATFASGVANGGSSDPVNTAPENYGWNTTNYAAVGTQSGERGIQFMVSTLGYTSIAVNWDLRTSNTSSRWQELQYTTDGSTWTAWPTLFENTGGDQWFNLREVDLGSIPGVENNANFGVRMVAVFAPSTSDYAAASSTYAPGGTWRFDMVAVTGVALPAVPPTKLAITSVNGGVDVAENVPFSLSVQSQDEDGVPQVVDADTEVTIAYVSGSGGNLGGTLVGTILANTNEVVINGILYDAIDAALQLSASVTSGPALTAATTTFPVLGLPVELVFVDFPATGNTNVALPAFTVEVRRSDNSVANDYTDDVSITLLSGTGNVVGTLTQAAVAGVATFSGISFDAAGVKTLEATSGSLSGESDAITISQFQFTAGRLVVLRNDGTTNAASASFLDEYATDGTPGVSLPLPVASAGDVNRLLNSGSATSEGQIVRSDDGRYITVAGYDANLGQASVGSTAGIDRVIGRVDANGAVATTVLTVNDATVANNSYAANNFRSVATFDGAQFWTGGNGNASTGGVRTIAFNGSTTTPAIAERISGGNNIRNVSVVDGELYYSTGSAPVGIYRVGNGAPTTTATAELLFTLQTGNTSPYAFQLLDRSDAVCGRDVIYVADDANGGRVYKYSFDGTSWTARGFVQAPASIYGLVGEVVNGDAVLFVTTPFSILTITDNAAFDADMNGDFDLVADAPLNNRFRGIAFAPQECVAPAITGITTNAPICGVDDLELCAAVTGTGPVALTWTGTGSFNPDASSASVSVSGAASGTYTLTASSTCGSVSAEVNVVVDPALTWYADVDGDGFGDPDDFVVACEQPEDYVANADDTCPAVVGVIGSACDDGNPNTVDDVLDASCNCVGTPVSPCEDVTLEFYTGNTPADLSWEIEDVQSNTVVVTGQGFVMPPDAVFPFIYCLPGDRQYKLRVTDNGDGASGYQLRYTATQARMIDNQNNLGTGTSEITGNAYSFSLPVGSDELIYTSCDKYWWKTNEYIVAAENAAVSALWIDGGANSVQSNNTGYEFWFYNPNGGYSFRKFRPHNVSDGFGNVGATRACHLKVNNWAVANHIPESDLMNVRVRSRVSGVNSGWGAACRFVRDEALAACPPTKLMDIPGNQFLSCNQFRQFGVAGSRIHARPVTGANLYQWRFRIEAENVEIIRTSTSYFLNLNWNAGVAAPLLNSKTYEVDVRASKDGGATWCGLGGEPWGDICSLTIGTPPAVGGNQNMSLSADGVLALWPNPNNGTEVWISLDGIDASIETVTVDIHDLTGKRISARILPTQDGSLLTALPLNGDLAAGLYLVTVTAGEAQYVQRLVIQN